MKEEEKKVIRVVLMVLILASVGILFTSHKTIYYECCNIRGDCNYYNETLSLFERPEHSMDYCGGKRPLDEVLFKHKLK